MSDNPGPENVASMLVLVRTARGMTQGEVAKRAHLSQGLLSKAETGMLSLDRGRLAAVARALDVPVDRFTSSAPPDDVLSACAFHRKRSSLSVSDAKRIRALLDLTRLQVEGLVDERTPELGLPRQSPSADGYTSPEDIAESVRRVLTEVTGPIANLVHEAEQLGVLMVNRNLGAPRIDAIGTWPAGHRPLFLLNSSAPADRKRFTLAHELGHTVMHPAPVPDQEAEADRFASELLMPAAEIRAELHNLSLARLVALKQRWRVSMAALVRRARDVGTISDHEYKMLNIEFSTAGYRTREPVDIADETPTLITEIIQRRLSAGETVTELARTAHQHEAEFQTLYGGAVL
jgi:Zn-dependent peptidase ImmA (M78 family)/transcriptional regulator with XRE-family HTH domain